MEAVQAVRKRKDSLHGMVKGPLRLHTGVPSAFAEGARSLDGGYPHIALNDSAANALHRFPENAIYTTKYTLWSFAPKLLYEQFRRATSAYFLLICILTSIKEVSPVDPFTSWAGLIFILAVAAVREAYEDYLRLKADIKVNNKKYTVLSAQGEAVTRSYTLRVGDLVRLHDHERVPVDLVVLATSRPESDCFVETAQLDGESNLKRRAAALKGMTPSQALSLRGELWCDVPSADLYAFKAALHRPDEPPLALDETHLLLAGTTLKHTDWVVGIVAYAGPETKLALNLKLPPSKFSSLDRKLNKYIALIFVFKLGLVAAMTLANFFFNQDPQARLVLDGGSRPLWLDAVLTFFTYFALMNYLIPLSLVVTLDVVRFCQARFVEWDRALQVSEHHHATAKTSNLNDELALVSYVLTDKTGTLTENDMRFRKAAIAGQVVEDSGHDALLALVDHAPAPQSRLLADAYLRALALAHQAEARLDEAAATAPTYAAPSPDDEALVTAAQRNRYEYRGRMGTVATVRVRGQDERYEVLLDVAFTSARARMAVVVRAPDQRRLLIVKGSDAAILPRLTKPSASSSSSSSSSTALSPVTSARELHDTEQALNTFASQGLRTLVVAQRELTDTQWQTWQTRYAAASAQLQGREAAVEALLEELERDLTLLGVTAIEDRLQASVPQTLATLRRAGVKIWMVTGDRTETALSIARSAQLVASQAVAVVSGDTADKVRRTVEHHSASLLGRGGKQHAQAHYALAVDGRALVHILADTALADDFMTLATAAEGVVCARVTPLQKAALVALVQEYTGKVVLAIGDGGNDVSMIQQSHVGVGIKGREGNQAARASDYALPQFQHLARLMFVHGRFSLLRNTKVIYMSFYKNVALFMGLIWFALFSGASGQALYGDWVMTFYNLVFTALPVLYVGLFEKDVREVVLEQHPEAYRAQRSLRYWTLLRWLGGAIWHSLVIYGCAYWTLAEDSLLSNGQSAGLRAFGALAMLIGFHVVMFKMALETTHYVFWGGVALAVSLVNFHGWQFLESVLFLTDQYAAFPRVVGSATAWLAVVVGLVLALMPDLVYAHLQRQLKPQVWQILQEKFASGTKRAQRHAAAADDSRSVPLLAISSQLSGSGSGNGNGGNKQLDDSAADAL